MSGIIGTDDRTIVTSEENFEFFDSVVAVDDLNKNGEAISVGSGIIVGSQHILTAAHVLTDSGEDGDIATTIYDENGARVIFADDVEDSARRDFALAVGWAKLSTRYLLQSIICCPPFNFGLQGAPQGSGHVIASKSLKLIECDL